MNDVGLLRQRLFEDNIRGDRLQPIRIVLGRVLREYTRSFRDTKLLGEGRARVTGGFRVHVRSHPASADRGRAVPLRMVQSPAESRTGTPRGYQKSDIAIRREAAAWDQGRELRQWRHGPCGDEIPHKRSAVRAMRSPAACTVSLTKICALSKRALGHGYGRRFPNTHCSEDP